VRLRTILGLATVACGFSAPAWSACVVSSTTDLQLQILGSGGPRGSNGRGSASYLLWIDGVGRVLIDTGGGTKDQFFSAGGNLADVQLIALSHLHPDHSAELPALLWPDTLSFDVAGPSAGNVFPSIDEWLDRMFAAGGAFEISGPRLDLNPIVVDIASRASVDIWQSGDLRITGRGVPHGEVPTIGYRVDLGDSSIAFSSDQNGSDPAWVEFIEGVDVLVIHLGGPENSTGMVANLHAKPSVWGQMAEAAGVGRVIVSHISTPSADVLAESLEYIRSAYDGPLTVGEDLMCIEVE
jgi:ribonuclease BN (tRNA processing enzyme)